MSNLKKSLPMYVMDENHFKDFEYEFDYCIIHKEKHTDYLCGTLSSALSEFITFKDSESLMYFLSLLVHSEMLIPVGAIYPPGTNDKSIIKLPDCKNTDYLYMKNVNVVPKITTSDNNKFFSVFLSIREIHEIAKNDTFLYIDFETVYKWIKKHRKEIDIIVFDAFDKYNYTWYVDTDDFIKQIDIFKKFEKNYKGKNLISDLHQISFQKHVKK
ncbi:MAG: hypothetical protein E7007_01465 [Alphaproteobacteria bacterium]|nr:hypothetical protein [Alphaproteobacteria bacterium]